MQNRYNKGFTIRRTSLRENLVIVKQGFTIRSKACNRSRGFTIIELLVVLGIIVIMMGVTLFALEGSRTSARDARRRADLQVIVSALELFRADCNYYFSGTWPSPGSPLNGSTCSPTNANVYLQAMPDDPAVGRDYVYQPQGCTSGASCTRFFLWAALEDPPALSAACASMDEPLCGSATCNYCVTNP